MRTRPQPAFIALRIGSWFEARATGWGVVVVPLSLLLVLAAGALYRLA